MVAWNFFFFVILFQGRRRRGEFKIGLIVLAKSKPRGSISSCGFRVCSVWVVGELVPGFLVSVLSGVCGGALLSGWSAALAGWLYFREEPHHRCLAGFRMCPLVVGVVSGGGIGEGEMEVHGICNRSLISREKVSSIGQAIRNLIFGDAEISLVGIQQGVTRLKKTGFVYLLAVVWRKRGEGVV